MPSPRANFCSHCGAALDESVNYCPQCGTKCRETTPAARTDTTQSSASASGATEADLTSFRRRVEAYLVDGWKMETDRGDSVLIRNPEYGSIPVHLLLLFFTGGIGNLAYGWWKYTHDGERRILRANGDDAVGIPSDAGSNDSIGVSSSVAGYVGGALSLLIATVMLASLELPMMVLGVFFLFAALWLLPATRRRLQNRHPVTTFGHTHSIDETTRVDPNKPCVVCSKPVAEGIERSYREEYVFAGLPLFTTEEGANQYCRSCASGGLSDYESESATDTDPVREPESQF